MLNEKFQKTDKIKSLFDFLGRNTVWMLFILISLSMLIFSTEVMFVIFYIILGEGLALALSNMSLYSYTKISFVKSFSTETDPLSKIANSIVISSIFVAVHLLVAASMYGIFLASK